MFKDKYLIRPAEEKDIGNMLPLLQHLFSLEEDFDFRADKNWKGLQLLIEDPKSLVLVAEIEGIIVGMCSGQQTISTAEGGPALLVEDLVILPEKQRQGLGKALLEHLKKWAASNGINRLQLLADNTNLEAIDFYLHNGWNRTRLICLRTTTSEA